MDNLYVGETDTVVPADTLEKIAQNSELMENISANHFRKGRLVFQFPTANEDAVSFYPQTCVCTGPCSSCGTGCWVIDSDPKSDPRPAPAPTAGA